MVRRVIVVVLASLCGVVLAGPGGGISAQEDPPEPETTIIVVTTGSDAVPEPECPHEADCSLREAILTANAIEDDGPIEIRFDPVAFPADEPVTIELADVLPAITADSVTLTGDGAGVRIDGSDLPEELAGTDGLVLQGEHATVTGLGFSGFGLACIRITTPGARIGGDPAANEGNTIDHCAIGIAVAGQNAVIAGNSIGLASADDDPRMAAGLWVLGGGARVGSLPGEDAPAAGNQIGHADIGIEITGPGARVEDNHVGGTANDPAPVGTAIALTAQADGALIRGNTIANTEAAGIALAARETDSANRITRNSFENIGGQAIDLLADGLPQPNDPDDADSGPNGLLNHPEPGRATVTAIAGVACAGCTIELYLAAHLPGSPNDQPRLFLAEAVADDAGAYTFTGLPLGAGAWVVASATNPEGQTSEFGPSVRVGAGQVECEPATLAAGWTFATFSGASVTLGLSFPESGPGAGSVTAIYELEAGAGSFRRSIAGTTIGRTLTALEPGKTYFFLSEAPVVLEGGFTLSDPFPITLGEGWNSLAYIGAADDYRDALSTLGDDLVEVYRFTALGTWESIGPAGTPAWARDFTAIESCRAYLVQMSAAGQLVPLQP